MKKQWISPSLVQLIIKTGSAVNPVEVGTSTASPSS
jgi:hypothetical protein